MVKELLMASLPVVTILNSREHHYLTSICSSTSVDIISIIRISIVSGDLQGTVLAPVLFVLYIPIVQWRSQNFNRLCYTEFCCSDCSIRVTALLGYLDLAGPVFLKPRTCKKLSGDARTITDELSSVSFTNFKCSIHPTGPKNTCGWG